MKKQSSQSAFTLIEMMIVVAIIGILIGGVFRLISAANRNTMKAETIERMQKLQNALTGYYSEYGHYPPVERVRPGDPYIKLNPIADTAADAQEVGDLLAENANAACGAQPIAFLFPNAGVDDRYVMSVARAKGGVSGNQLYSGANLSQGTATEWRDGVKIFQFGVLSFLLPRVEILGGDKAGMDGDGTPRSIFQSAQWRKYNNGSLSAIREHERRTCSKWLVNFEKELQGGPTIYGITLTAPNSASIEVTTGVRSGASQNFALQRITMLDAWDTPIYYYSEPPYQSYRIWSAGPNKNSFPPWVQVKALPSGDQELVTEWTEDDISRFDR